MQKPYEKIVLNSPRWCACCF